MEHALILAFSSANFGGFLLVDLICLCGIVIRYVCIWFVCLFVLQTASMATPAGNIFSPNAGAGEIPYPPQHEEEDNDKARTGQHQAWPYTIML